MAESKKSATKKAATSAGPSAPESGPLAKIFGIRHLSPAGAWHLSRYLAEIDPTAILIEGPSDATELLPHLLHKKTRPPIALLAFTKQRPVRSILYPLAEYSPEWVAATTGLRAKKLVRFIDLPASTFLALHASYARADAAPADGDPAAADGDAAPSPTQAYLDDPYAQIAKISGSPDHDTWWEKHFEHATADGAYREAIHAFGHGLRELRTDGPRREKETLVREAYMRRMIRETIAEGHDPARIVVVCGAYHAPVLTAEIPAMTDAQLKDLPSLETTLTLMPYSYYRLSAQSGYGAGNHAPGYFQALWEATREEQLARLPMRFMAEVAGHLRKSGQIRSSAEVIEAVRLAQTLAALAGDATAPTLRDLRDAATTCLGHGDANVVARALGEVEVGAAIGGVAPGVARTSLQDDFYHLVGALKLDDYLKDKEQPIKGAKGEYLDLREDRFVKSPDAAFRDRRRSIFLHRLEVLGIGFAKDITTDDDRATSTFKEAWRARWTPECEINLVENALRGDTIEIATVRAFGEKLGEAADVGAAAALARQAVRCDLRDGMDAAITRVQALAVEGAGFASMAEACVEIAQLTRYKGVTDVDVTPLRPLVAQLFLRATLLAPEATHCDDDSAKRVGRALAYAQSVASFDDWGDDFLATDRWYATLNAIADDDGANPYVAGVACALLLERALVTDEKLEQRVARRISPGMDPGAGAGYFEGLASRNHMALLSRKKLWAAMTGFVESLDHDAFRRAVVGLRRAFASFELSEARRIGTILAEVWGGGGVQIAHAVETKLDDAEAKALESELGDLGDLDL